MSKLALCLIVGYVGLFGIACSETVPTSPGKRTLTPAMPNGGGGPPKVNATDPNGADQNTRLVVRVLGANFDDGSTVTFKLDRKDVADVVTNSTTFVSDSELEADVTIGAEAIPDFYDIEVQTSRGKKGIGVELFEVRQATYTMTVSGDLAGSDPDATGDHNNGFDQIVGGIPMLNIQGWASNSANLQKCFPDPEVRSGAFAVSRDPGGGVRVAFFPIGNGTNDPPTQNIKYIVTMTGSITDGPFPPVLGDDATVEILDWEIGHDSGKGKKVACDESGTFSQPTSVAISRNPPTP